MIKLIKKIIRICFPKIQKFEYSYIFASRKVIKNQSETQKHYYDSDIWTETGKNLIPFLSKGMSIYYEVVGYLSTGGMIQKDYDYGCDEGKHDVYIYRITYTNDEGKVFEFSGKQVQNWCKQNGLKSVPELYYGYANDLFLRLKEKHDIIGEFNEVFMDCLKKEYLEKPSNNLPEPLVNCRNKVPDEGVVIRVEDNNDIESYKLKSFAFLKKETEDLDKGISDIESEN